MDFCAVCLVNVCACCHFETVEVQYEATTVLNTRQKAEVSVIKKDSEGDCPKLLLVRCADPGCLSCLDGQCVYFAAEYISFRRCDLLNIVRSGCKRLAR